LSDFYACEQPDASIVHRRFRCTESTHKPNGAVKICVYTDLKEWREENGERVVAVEGFLSNTGEAPLCNLTVDIRWGGREGGRGEGGRGGGTEGVAART